MTQEPAVAATVRVAAAQKRFTPGDRAGNLQVHLRAIEEAAHRGIDLLVFPELSLTGMVRPSEVPALALRPESAELRRLATASKNGPSLVIGFIELADNYLFYNSQAYLEDGEIRAIQRKIYLPGYGFFDESQAFASGETYGAFDTKFGRMAMLICEDAWHSALPYAATADGAIILLTCAASPEGGTSADMTSEELWTTVNRASAVTLKCFNIFANHVGSSGELQYWGGSHIIAPSGKTVARGELEREDLICADIDLSQIAIQRHNYRYIQDERLDLTIRELQRIGDERWSRENRGRGA